MFRIAKAYLYVNQKLLPLQHKNSMEVVVYYLWYYLFYVVRRLFFLADISLKFILIFELPYLFESYIHNHVKWNTVVPVT